MRDTKRPIFYVAFQNHGLERDDILEVDGHVCVVDAVVNRHALMVRRETWWDRYGFEVLMLGGVVVAVGVVIFDALRA